MPTVTIPRTDITSDQIGAALRDGLDDRYDVLPGMRMTRIPVGSPRAADPDEIVVGKGPSPMVRAQVTIIRRADRTDIRGNVPTEPGCQLVAEKVQASIADAFLCRCWWLHICWVMQMSGHVRHSLLVIGRWAGLMCGGWLRDVRERR
jgi:hypothetical protein